MLSTTSLFLEASWTRLKMDFVHDQYFFWKHRGQVMESASDTSLTAPGAWHQNSILLYNPPCVHGISKAKKQQVFTSRHLFQTEAPLKFSAYTDLIYQPADQLSID